MKWIDWGAKNTHRYAAIIVSVIIIVTEILNSVFFYYSSPSSFIIPDILHVLPYLKGTSILTEISKFFDTGLETKKPFSLYSFSIDPIPFIK